jgi:chlorobactene glucosyltransferase
VITYLAVINGLLLLLLTVILINSIFAPCIKKGPIPSKTPFVSILIPARDEALNISHCLEGLIRQQYPHYEIVVLDDHSQDDTAKIVCEHARLDDRIQLISGEELPVGWTGKNWACHQLSQNARGEILIFTDADNTHAPDAVLRTVGWIQKLHLGLISAFPQQITATLPEKLVVPVFDMFVYSYLPLWLTFLSKFPSLAAANGQWLAFSKEGYEVIGGHAAARNQIVEDTFLARLAKKKGIKTLTCSGKEAIWGHMYHSWNQVWLGFSKNAFGLVGFKKIPFFILISLMISLYLAPYLLVWFSPYAAPAAVAIALNVFSRAILAWKFKQPFWIGVIFHPLGIIVTIFIALNSFVRYCRGGIMWKNRFVKL